MSQLDLLAPPIATAADLPNSPPLLIIDALCGPHYSAPNGKQASPLSLPSGARDPTVAAMRHVHQLLRLHEIPILSFELPAGIDGTSGAAWPIPLPLEPNWILAFGRPKEGLARLVEAGSKAEVMLAYVGDLGGEDKVFGERFACGLARIGG